MKLNENVAIVGEKVILIPYEAIHVQKYHNWMQCEELQELTASEPLSLDQEYQMQQSWRNDDDKCTFLILAKKDYLITKNEEVSLIGDTNIFIQTDHETGEKAGEAEIMIAEKKYRGQGLGIEAMLLMLNYGRTELRINKFVAKIGEENEASVNMFKKVQFQETSRSLAFKEITMECFVTENWINWLKTNIKCTYLNYNKLKDIS